MQIGGLTTTTNQTEEQWDYPNGWAPLQWLVIRGLEKYGYTELASEISERWIRTCDIGFKAMGSMLEKYNVVDPGKIATGGEYALQTGFGWTNGVITDLLE
jgi:alpha,alpha-trehalase